ncbi:MAG: 4-oxalocrotonate tautomerase family protein [Rhodospirillaceae bacterium]|nr:4-oxalocrotonate tautomerase family protein [Rhodospirillaceae bacterium]
MPLIQVSIMQGRSEAQKSAFAAKVTVAACETLDVKPEQVRVLINELPPQNWFVGGVAKAGPGPRGA